jgi:hypothetical protein
LVSFSPFLGQGQGPGFWCLSPRNLARAKALALGVLLPGPWLGPRPRFLDGHLPGTWLFLFCPFSPTFKPWPISRLLCSQVPGTWPFLLLFLFPSFLRVRAKFQELGHFYLLSSLLLSLVGEANPEGWCLRTVYVSYLLSPHCLCLLPPVSALSMSPFSCLQSVYVSFLLSPHCLCLLSPVSKVSMSPASCLHSVYVSCLLSPHCLCLLLSPHCLCLLSPQCLCLLSPVSIVSMSPASCLRTVYVSFLLSPSVYVSSFQITPSFFQLYCCTQQQYSPFF